ncbi:hypothetical protein FNH22_20370 [Fulvivirga sp. M361]|uniref:carboxypeptidase-like regulatory domain-containing protein n=1 Tax=Fulvivirga sp. M361 TaxID=2594266 RepID=UPI00117ABDDB|nr:carboxypeptidase-like regulatory domain-containing protein [Fulvivirga sp. M361]TRX53712.1 hypothetical protein FNH22_20370 [Fulvivirga sp. M361]
MSDNENHMDPLSAEQMSKYLNGELSDKEMHRMEKLMLDSDFESEAMEGFEGSGINLKNDLADLNSRLEERIHSEKKIFPAWFKIAASIAILAISAVIVFTWDFQSDNEQLVQKDTDRVENKIPAEEESKELPEMVSKSLRDDSLIALNETIATEEETQNPLSPPEQTASLPDGPKIEAVEEEEIMVADVKKVDKLALNRISEEVAGLEISKADDSEIADTQAEADEIMETTAEPSNLSSETSNELKQAAPARTSSARKQALYKKEKNKTSSGRVIRGQVVSESDGAGIPGVNVILKGTNKGTVTDIEGNYTITIPALEEAVLSFNYIGYSSIEKEVNDNETLDASLYVDNASLSEVVVVGSNNGSTTPPPVRIGAKPVHGRSDYKRYLENNIRIPADSLKGRVIVEFDVRPNGDLSNFTIKKGLKTEYDLEAIRLIKEGPNWTPATENDRPVLSKTQVKVRFK